MPDADTIAGTRDESFGEPEAGISIRGDPASAVEPSGALCPIAPRVVIHSGLHATRLTVIAAEPCPACSPSIQAISPPGPVAPGVAGCETPRRFSSHSAAELKAAFVTGVANGDDCAVSNSPQVLVVDPDGKLRVESYSASLEAMAGVTQAVLDETGLRDDGGAAGRR